MKIKTSLRQLVAVFAQDAATEEMPLPIRRFAASLTVLTAHVERLEQALLNSNKGVAGLTELTSELTDAVAIMRGMLPKDGAVEFSPEATAAPVQSSEVEAGGEEEGEDDIIDKIQRDTDAEMRQVQAATRPKRPAAPAAPPVTALTPVPAPASEKSS